MSDKTERFLEQVTAGLATDPELRLDVQAELRAHIEDKTAELGGGDHADEAVASLGEVVELAEEVAQANQRRLGWRHLARRAIRFGLVPASVVCAIWFSGWREVHAMREYQNLYNSNVLRFPVAAEARLPRYERLLFYGDSSREGILRYRTLWEENPSNVVYYADYITHVVENEGSPSPPVPFWSEEEPTRPSKAALAELAEGRKVDPQNSRYPILAALFQIKDAAELETEMLSRRREGTYSLKVKDRPALDHAMAELLTAAELPQYRRYRNEVVQERLAVLGPPQRLVDCVRWYLMAGSTILPDLSRLRESARFSIAYAELLVAEGHPEEAVPFLEFPEDLGRKLVGDSSFLIDYLVSQALFYTARERVPAILRQIGHEEQAREAEVRLTAIRRPMELWNNRRRGPTPDLDELLTERAGVLATMLLPFLGGLDATDLAPRLAASRRMELTAAVEMVAGLVGLLLVVAMGVSLAIAIRWRWTLGRQSAPLLLLPSAGDLCRFVLLGVVVPFAGFLAWTHWLPFSGHAYSFKYAGHRVTAEFVTLLAALLLLPPWLGLRAFRRRCTELELPPPPRCSRLVYWPLGVAALLIVVGYVLPVGYGVMVGQVLVGIGGAIVVVLLLVLVLFALLARRRYGRTLGTLSRSLVSVFAAAALLLGLVVRPVLLSQEHRLFQADTILAKAGPDGICRIKTETVRNLREATLKAMAENPMP